MHVMVIVLMNQIEGGGRLLLLLLLLYTTKRKAVVARSTDLVVLCTAAVTVDCRIVTEEGSLREYGVVMYVCTPHRAGRVDRRSKSTE